ncbi:adenosylcobinamide-phosphate synthase CbiB [Hypericibacter terrae]|nr:adenosylcobinamide-phosphate synthase CbiB [Hypericibacter terrae]
MFLGSPTLLPALLLALALDAGLGDPAWLWQRIPHPVALAGWAIDQLDRALNRDEAPDLHRRIAGVAALSILMAASFGIGLLIHALLNQISWGWLIEAALMATLLAQNSLYRHVEAVARALADGTLAEARDVVRHIVGRDPESLDRPAVARAAIESLAENFADGVLAPLFWGLLFGLPGMMAYKAANTADSMIGHRTQRHEAFGWASARFDDLLNLAPARLSGLLIALASFQSFGDSVRVMLKDAPRHRSPNAGWPEAAMAGALEIALAGPRTYYGGRVGDSHWVNEDGRRELGATDIRNALALYLRACLIEAALVALLWILVR